MELQIPFITWSENMKERTKEKKKKSLNVVLFLSSNSFFQIPCNIRLYRLHVPYDFVWVGCRRGCAPSLLDSFVLQRSLSNRHLHNVFYSREMDRVCIYQWVYCCSEFHSLDPAWVKNLTKQKQQHPNSVWGWAWSWRAEEHLSCPQGHSWAWAAVPPVVTADQQHFCNSCPALNKGEWQSFKTACWQNPVL